MLKCKLYPFPGAVQLSYLSVVVKRGKEMRKGKKSAAVGNTLAKVLRRGAAGLDQLARWHTTYTHARTHAHRSIVFSMY